MITGIEILLIYVSRVGIGIEKILKMIIKLNKQELIHAGITGLFRYIESQLSGRTPYFKEKYSGEQLGYGVMGAFAEVAVAKALKTYYDYSVNTFHVSDIPDQNIEVRYSKTPYCKVREDDNSINVVSVTGDIPEFEIRGYIYSEDAKLPHYSKDFNNVGRPAYFVPSSHLKPIEQLIKKG